ncbi:hypothetical protein Tco_0339449 [Tanacetum coccineum]
MIVLQRELDGFGLGSLDHGRGDFLDERTTGNTNIRQCFRKVANGHFTTAMKVPLKCQSTLVIFSLDSGGTEVVLHRASRVLIEYHNDGSLAMLTVYFSNAFNLVDRSTLLHEAIIWCEASWGRCWRQSCSLKKDYVGRSRTWWFVEGLSLETYSGDLLLYPFDLVVWVCTQQKWLPLMLLWARETNLSLCDVSPSFDFSGFTDKESDPSKAQQTLVSALFSEMIKDMEVYFKMTVRQK